MAAAAAVAAAAASFRRDSSRWLLQRWVESALAGQILVLTRWCLGFGVFRVQGPLP